MKLRLHKAKRGRKSFKKELKRQLKYAIAAGAGFIIIYAWKEAIWNSTRNIVDRIIDSNKIAIGNLATSLLITIIGVAIILISARVLREKR